MAQFIYNGKSHFLAAAIITKHTWGTRVSLKTVRPNEALVLEATSSQGISRLYVFFNDLTAFINYDASVIQLDFLKTCNFRIKDTLGNGKDDGYSAYIGVGTPFSNYLLALDSVEFGVKVEFEETKTNGLPILKMHIRITGSVLPMDMIMVYGYKGLSPIEVYNLKMLSDRISTLVYERLELQAETGALNLNLVPSYLQSFLPNCPSSISVPIPVIQVKEQVKQEQR